MDAIYKHRCLYCEQPAVTTLATSTEGCSNPRCKAYVEPELFPLLSMDQAWTPEVVEAARALFRGDEPKESLVFLPEGGSVIKYGPDSKIVRYSASWVEFDTETNTNKEMKFEAGAPTGARERQFAKFGEPILLTLMKEMVEQKYGAFPAVLGSPLRGHDRGDVLAYAMSDGAPVHDIVLAVNRSYNDTFEVTVLKSRMARYDEKTQRFPDVHAAARGVSHVIKALDPYRYDRERERERQPRESGAWIRWLPITTEPFDVGGVLVIEPLGESPEISKLLLKPHAKTRRRYSITYDSKGNGIYQFFINVVLTVCEGDGDRRVRLDTANDDTALERDQPIYRMIGSHVWETLRDYFGRELKYYNYLV